MTLRRKHQLSMAAVVVLLFVSATPLGGRHHGLGQHSQAVANLSQTIWVIALISTAALIVLGILAAVQFATRRRALRKGTLMRIRTSMAAATVAALVGGGLVVALPASGAPVTHTLHFTTREQARNPFPGTPAGAEFEKDYAAGKLVGYGIVDIAHFGHDGTAWAALAINGGMIYGSLQLTGTGVLTGEVVSGSGAYQGVTGTLVKKGVSVTITYHY